MNEFNPQSIYNPSEFFLQTPMIERLHERLHEWLWNGITGGLILGDYRIGKTRAVKHLSKRLVNRDGEEIYAHQFSITRRDQNTITSVYRNLFMSLSMELKPRITSDQMANDLFHYFGERALSNSTKQVVLIVDEFQRLHVRQLDVFAELYDNLAMVNINLCVLFVGNTAASQPLIEHALDPSNELIRGRFFTKLFTYQGIRNHSDLRECLRGCDSKILYNGEETSITKYFLGSNYQPGWKVSSISSEIWNVFKDEYQSKLKLNSWGMQYFIAMLKTLLVDYLPNYPLDDKDDLRHMIRQSIDVSGLVPDLVRVANA